MKIDKIQFLNTELYTDANEELVYQKNDGSEIVISDLTDTTYGSSILTSANTYAAANFLSANTSYYTQAQANANFLSASTSYQASITSTNEQVIYNSGGTLKGDVNMTFNSAAQTLSVGKIELTTGTVSSFKMKAADGTGTVYNVYISGGTFTIAST